MQKVIPKKKAAEPSPAARLVADCRTAFRKRSTDRTALEAILTGLETQHAQLAERFEGQKPGWNDSDTGDLLRKAAASVLQVCVEGLRLRIDFVKNQTDDSSPSRLVPALLNILCPLTEVAEYALLTSVNAATDTQSLADRELKILSFERATHEVQVDAYCCFLRDLKQYSPIKKDLIQEWLSTVHSRNAVGHSIRREGYSAGSLLVALSRLPADLFSGGCTTSDRSAISLRILTRTGDSSEQSCGTWEWFDKSASQLCSETLARSGFISVPEQRTPTKPERFLEREASDKLSTSFDVTDLRAKYDELHRFVRSTENLASQSLRLRDCTDIELHRLPVRLHEWTVENVAHSSFPQLKSLCNGDLEVLATTLRICGQLLASPRESSQKPVEDNRQVSEELEARFKQAVDKIGTNAVDEGILNTALITVRPPTFKSLPQRLLELPISAVAAKTLTEHNHGGRAMGHLTAQRFVEYFESVVKDISAVPVPGQSTPAVASSFLRFVYAQDRMKQHAASSLLDQPVSAWIVDGDRHLPQKLVNRSIRSILNLTFRELETTKGVGAAKVKRLLTIVERGLDAVDNGLNGLSSTVPQSGEPIERRKDTWPEICLRLNELGLAGFPLGRFAESLSDLPRSLWAQPLGLYLDRARHEVREMDGIGRQRSESICKIIERLGSVLPVGDDGSFGIRLLAKELHQASSWVEEMLHSDDEPTLKDVTEKFLRSLLRQIEIDLGVDVAEMVEQRLGIEQPPLTLEGIAETRSITRERVRQITGRAAEAIDVRWPEAQFLMDDLFERVRESLENAVLVPLMKRAFDLLVSYTPEANSSIELVAEAWERAGRQKLTPMNEEDMFAWASREFPRTPARTVVRWLTSESPNCLDESGRRLWFSNSELDSILHSLYTSKNLHTLSELVDDSGLGERNLQGRLQRDIRFVEDDNKLFGPAAHFGIERLNGVWTIELTPLKQQSLLADTISLESLAHLVVAGLLQREIVDATCWGVHRFANECVGRMFGAALPEKLTAIVLADLLVKASGGLIRPMRRRRLRWDHKHSGINAKGKRGWVNFAVEDYGKPVVLTELRGLLSNWYQDYAAYVVNQLGSAAGEEDDEGLSVVWQTSTVASLPTIVQPTSWSLDKNGDNVSDEIRLLTSRLIKQARKGELSKRGLRSIPWMIQLIEFRSYGAVKWTENDTTNIIEEETDFGAQTDADNNDEKISDGDDSADPTVVEVDSLLAKFI